MKTIFAFCLCLLIVRCATAAPPPLRYIDPDRATGSSAAVIAGNVTLVHTDQVLPGESSATASATGQLANVLQQLDAVLRRAGSDMQHVAKLSVYLANEQIADEIRRGLAARFSDGHGPATSFVVTSLARSGALIALDAVAAADPIPNAPLVSARFLSAGARLYVSGQADRSMELREATRKTLEGLTETLRHCGRSIDDIVQLKCFFQPMSSIADVRDEINHYFAAEGTPPLAFVEWKASSPPIEIELVAWSGPAHNEAKEPLEFITPIGMSASPVFSRVARINRGETIFIGDIASPTTGSVDQQMQTSFDALGKLLVKSDSDFQHLAKATYYVTDDEISKAHNAIRPEFYEAARPPAASKALVAGTGHPGSRYVMDMIAVPKER